MSTPWTWSKIEVLMSIGFDDVVRDVTKDWPATIRVFLDFRMGCVGCPIAGPVRESLA